jgi:hypothetical protein
LCSPAHPLIPEGHRGQRPRVRAPRPSQRTTRNMNFTPSLRLCVYKVVGLGQCDEPAHPDPSTHPLRPFAPKEQTLQISCKLIAVSSFLVLFVCHSRNRRNGARGEILFFCHPDRGPERPERRDPFDSLPASPNGLRRDKSLARDDVPTGLPRPARRHVTKKCAT